MSVADEIAKLADLRDQGLITDAEFEQQKKAMFGGKGSDATEAPIWEAIPLRQKWSFQKGMALLVPVVGVVLFLFVPAYEIKKGQAGQVARVSKAVKTVFVVLVLVVWGWLALLVGERNGGVGSIGVAVTVPGCASPEARETLEHVIENQARTDLHLKLLDLTAVSEVVYDRENDARYCQGTATLNSGEQAIAFRLFPKSDKTSFLLEVRPMIPTAGGGVNPWVLTGEISEIKNRLASGSNAPATKPATAAQPEAQWTEILKEVKAAAEDCKTKRLSGELKTFVASANCSNSKILEIFQSARYPDMDLVGQLTAKRLEVAERIDAGIITEEEAQLQITSFMNNLGGLQRERQVSQPASGPSNDAAFVRQIIIEGRGQTTKESLAAALGVRAGSPMSAFDPEAAQERIARLPSVSSVVVERRMPDTIVVHITELPEK